MTQYQWLVHLYPLSWRQRYGEEFAAVLETRRLGLVDMFDVVRGALDAHVHARALFGEERTMATRLRRSEIAVFSAWILFVVSGIGFQKMSEDFARVQHQYPAIGIPFDVVVAGAVVALLAVLAGGLPIAFAALLYALRQRQRDVLVLFLVPPLALAVWLGYTFIALRLNPASTQLAAAGATPPHAWAYIWVGLFVVAAILSTASVARAVSVSQISERVYRLALGPAVVAVGAMTVVLVAVVAWGIAVQVYVPQMYNGNHGFLASPTAGSWILHIVTMGLAVLIATAALTRRAGGRPRGSRQSPQSNVALG